MGTKKHRMTVGFDKGDIDFLQELGIFKSTGDGIRFAVKLMRLYSIPTLKAIKEKELS
ncbi:hypothetical protein Ngar_c17130 [Candidatus Nitrososphaera gargensis Ga9.2]|uniref:Uncharacterized protein n=1 Tax=Nitrososphaera gargensis (strain Ga9.2) TaxID=1237085 RepID=K0IBJ2_NITGG|nr:hypothetical protein [Candidatus Nitrososphaera gargensis]AFU58646.1 hypothetical protein Ngar_c17130 [Candidatus Nitrososphaera gargensis Ga9.2]